MLKRRDVHVATETAALVTVLPLSVYAASNPRLPLWARVTFAGVAVATAVVDGGLLVSYLRNKKGTK
jgi:hypothetical protein